MATTELNLTTTDLLRAYEPIFGHLRVRVAVHCS